MISFVLNDENDKGRFFTTGKKFDEVLKMGAETDNLYDLEKNLDKIWVEFSRTTLEGVVEEQSTTDRRKKK